MARHRLESKSEELLLSVACACCVGAAGTGAKDKISSTSGNFGKLVPTISAGGWRSGTVSYIPFLLPFQENNAPSKKKKKVTAL